MVLFMFFILGLVFITGMGVITPSINMLIMGILMMIPLIKFLGFIIYEKILPVSIKNKRYEKKLNKYINVVIANERKIEKSLKDQEKDQEKRDKMFDDKMQVNREEKKLKLNILIQKLNCGVITLQEYNNIVSFNKF